MTSLLAFLSYSYHSLASLSTTLNAAKPDLALSNWRFHGLRYGVILLISLLITHVLSYNKLPFSEGYQFPTLNFLIISGFGLTICTANWIVYHNIKLPILDSYAKQLTQQLLVQFLSTVVFYSVLYVLVINQVFGADFLPAHYLKYLVICSAIILIEFLFVELMQMSKVKQVDQPQLIHIPTMTKDLYLSMDDIEMLQTTNGIVTLYTKEHNPLITRHSSLEEVALPSSHFYRINRQSLLNRNAISSVRRKPNRTLEVDLNLHGQEATTPLVVSRYKRSEFMKWLKGNAGS